MNEYQKLRFTKRIISCLFNNLTEKKIAVLGFAFKKNTSDTRESPAITLVSNLVAEKARVAIYDPKVKEEQIWLDLINNGGDPDQLKAYVEVYECAYGACTAADAVVVVTEWDEFSNKEVPKPPPPQVQTKVLSELNPNCTLTVKANTNIKDSYLQRSPDSNLGLRSNAVSVTVLETMDGFIAKGSKNGEAKHDSRIDWGRVATSMRKPMFVFDGRNILDAPKLEKLGFRVEAIGRASTLHHSMRNCE